MTYQEDWSYYLSQIMKRRRCRYRTQRLFEAHVGERLAQSRNSQSASKQKKSLCEYSS